MSFILFDNIIKVIIKLYIIIYLAVTYYYPGSLLGWELTTIFLFIFIDEIRLLLGIYTSLSIYILYICINCDLYIYTYINYYILYIIASKGNKTSTSNPLIYSLVLSIPMIILHAYYIALQTYV